MAIWMHVGGANYVIVRPRVAAVASCCGALAFEAGNVADDSYDWRTKAKNAVYSIHH